MERIVKQSLKTPKALLREEYQLILKNDVYFIKATEHNLESSALSVEEVSLKTTNKRKAKRMYSIIVKNEVCVGTIKDVITDLMC